MKKNIFAIAALTLGMLGFSAFAQAPETPCTDNANCPAANDPGQNNKMRQPQSFTEFAFEGILLEPAQQQRIDSLNQAFEAQRQACKEAKEAKCKNGKEGKCKEAKCKECPNCQNGQNCQECPNCNAPKCNKDSAKCKDGKPACTRKNPRREYAAKVKEILTPEQYVVFLENISFMPEKCDKMQGPRGDRMMKGGKDCPKMKGFKDCPKMKDCQKAKGTEAKPAVKASASK